MSEGFSRMARGGGAKISGAIASVVDGQSRSPLRGIRSPNKRSVRWAGTWAGMAISG